MSHRQGITHSACGGPREGLLSLRKNRPPVSPAGHERQLKGATGLTKEFINGKNPRSGKIQGIWKCCQTRGKTQGILFAQVINSDSKDRKMSNFAKSVSDMKLSQISEIATGKMFNWTGKTQEFLYI